MVCPSPLECILIDYEAAARKDELGDEEFAKRRQSDFLPMLREAIFLQCSLGPQPGPFAEMARARAGEVLKRPERFLTEIGEQSKIA